ncbi:hypothetical protein MTO96_028695, partial [Rhipicephalus appendiculatus]
MYAENLRFAVSKAHLVSIKMSPTPDAGRCFTFWYNMWHPNVGKLNLMKRVDNASNSLLWTRSSPQGKEWKQGQVQLYSDDPHQLVFEAVLNSGKRGMIAIDNFVLNDTSCSSDKSGGCNFESDSCGWQLHNWERTSASKSFKPTSDHTTLSPTGRFVLAKSPGGRMVSPESWYDATKPKCFRFWFFLTGTPAETLRVTRVLKGGQEIALWRDTPYQDNSKQWRQASVNLPAYNETPTIVFDATTSDAPGAVIAVDDISLVSNTTGVQNDHTLGTTKGYYLLLDAADLIGAAFGSLQSQKLPLGPSVCFSLYYSLKNGSGASLTVAFFDQKGAIVGRPKRVQNSTPREWKRLSIERTDLPDLFSVIISGQTSRGRSDVMIDDIDVRRGKCPEIAHTTIIPGPETESPVRPTTPATTEPVPTQEITSTEPPTLPTEVITPESVTSEVPPAPEPRPPLVCRRDEFSCRDDSTCIPLALLCDGVKDCPNGLDEKCGNARQCKENEFLCATGSASTCMPRSLLCDGREDCAGGSDESLCRACPHYFCKNGGICGWTPKEPSPTCDCRDGYKGRRCNLLASTVPEADNLTSK